MTTCPFCSLTLEGWKALQRHLEAQHPHDGEAITDAAADVSRMLGVPVTVPLGTDPFTGLPFYMTVGGTAKSWA